MARTAAQQAALKKAQKASALKRSKMADSHHGSATGLSSAFRYKREELAKRRKSLASVDQPLPPHPAISGKVMARTSVTGRSKARKK